MRISPDVFNSMTPAEFIYAQMGYLKLKEQESRQAWEVARYVAFITTSIQIDQKQRKPMTEMLPLPWDSITSSKKTIELTDEERRVRVQKILKCQDV